MTQGKFGNTNRICRSRSYCFTLNNYTEQDINNILTQFKRNEWLYILGKELGENKTPHIQGYCAHSNAFSFNTLKKIIPRAHIEKAKGSMEQNYKYCSKQNNYITNISMDIAKTPDELYEDEMKEEYDNIVWKPWQQKVLDILETKPDRRTINWIWESQGNVGKTFLCKYIDWKHDAILANGKSADVLQAYAKFFEIKKTQPKVALVDIPRVNQNYISYSTFEKIKDGLVQSGKYEGAKLRICKHHLFVFANFEPDYDKLSNDRWNIIKI